jgi:hypothetical protein
VNEAIRNIPLNAGNIVNYGHLRQASAVGGRIALIGQHSFGPTAPPVTIGYTTDRFPLVARFRQLADQWIAETMDMSSIEDMIAHPAYLQIIGMGESAIPLLLYELEREPNHWFSALIAVSGGQNPVGEDEAGDLDKMAEAWMRWARENSYR